MLDGVLARYDVREVHGTTVAASAQDAFAAAMSVRAASDPIVSTLFRIRRIPGGELPLREFIGRLGFTELVSTDRSVSAIWDVAGVRIGFALWSDPLPAGGARLVTETRVLARDTGSRVRFRLYWLVVGPFSALIRRRWLRAAKRQAEIAA